MANLRDDTPEYCHILWSIVFFALFCTGCVLLSQEVFLQDAKCILTNKSHSPFQCSGQINVCTKNSIECIINCNSKYYNLEFDFVLLDQNGNTKTFNRACGRLDNTFELLCNCCSYSRIQICEVKSFNHDDKCPPILELNLIVYDKFKIGKMYPCWTNSQGNVYAFDKSHVREIASIVLICIEGLVLICNAVYFLHMLYNCYQKDSL